MSYDKFQLVKRGPLFLEVVEEEHNRFMNWTSDEIHSYLRRKFRRNTWISYRRITMRRGIHGMDVTIIWQGKV